MFNIGLPADCSISDWRSDMRRAVIIFHATGAIRCVNQRQSINYCLKKKNEKALRETQTLRAGCSIRRSRKISPRRRPSSRRDRTAKIKSAGVGHYLHLQEFGEDRCTQSRVIVVTDPQTHTNTATNPQTGPITIHCAAKPIARSVTILN